MYQRRRCRTSGDPRAVRRANSGGEEELKSSMGGLGGEDVGFNGLTADRWVILDTYAPTGQTVRTLGARKVNGTGCVPG